MDPLCVSNAQSFSVAEEDPRPSSTSVVATLRHSPRLLLRKKTSSNSAKEPQSPDIFARGPGPALRPSTRLQTRISRMSARAKKTPSITLTTSVEVTSASAATESGLSNSATISVAASSVQYGPPNQSSASSTASSTSSPSPSYVSDAMDVFQPSITATSTTGRLTRSTLHQLQHGLHRLPNPSNTSEGYSPELHERPSRVATRNTSQSRERESSGRPGTRSRARSRLTSSNKPHSPMSSASEAGSGRGSRKDTVQALLHISRERPGSADNKEAVDDEDADDDDDDHFSSQRVLRASARTRRRAYKSSTTEGGVDREARTVPEAGTRLRLTRSRHSRHYGQAGHLREQTKQDYNDEHIRLSKVKQSCAGAVRSVGAIADNGQSVGALAEQQKNRRAQDTDRQVPNLHPATRSVRARSTKVARMGIDDYGEEEEEEDDDEVAADEDDEQEADGEDEDADYDQCPKSDPDEEGLLSRQGQFKQRISQPKRSSQQQQLPYPPSTPPQPPSTPSQQLQQQSQQNVFANLPCAQDTQATLDGFITSKPESPAAHVAVNPANQNLSHYKRKVEEDEEMEDAPISADEGQLVSTKLARIDESDGQERSAYMRSLCSILKSPREEYDGILSSESEDADLESEDDEDDFEEIDV
ncbi:hypothetical protein BGZ73_001823 [Actinomortierella ambigua]|nr:hypothetical protein BGZ73_001823 [Actinomortierella ambigua]